MAMCSVSDLGEKTHCVLFATIQGVNRDFSINLKGKSNFFCINPSLDSLMGSECYFSLSHDTDNPSEEIKNIAIMFLPKLASTEFKVKSLVGLRLSQTEFNIIHNDIPNSENL